MRSATLGKRTKGAVFMGMMAGLSSGVLLGNTPMVLASPTCHEKIECAQMPVPSEVCGDRCNKLNYCGKIITNVGLGFLVEETSDDGYEDYWAEGARLCYTAQSCKKNPAVVCPTDPEEWACINDDNPENEIGFDEGAFADAC